MCETTHIRTAARLIWRFSLIGRLVTGQVFTKEFNFLPGQAKLNTQSELMEKAKDGCEKRGSFECD